MLADVVTLDKGLIQSGVCRGRADGVLHSAAKRALGGQHSAWEVLDTSVQ